MICVECGINKDLYAKGLCYKCYKRLQYHANKNKEKNTVVADLPGEIWKQASAPGVFVSNQGRVKKVSKLKRGEKAKLLSVNTKIHAQSSFMSDGKTYRLALEVMRAFSPPVNGEKTLIFLDGNTYNSHLGNLAWYGYDYMIDKAIKMAEQSCSPLADCFLLFWCGKNDALDDFFKKCRTVLIGMIAKRLDRFQVPYFVDPEDIASESLVQIFFRIKNAQIKTIDNIMAWCKAIAKKVLAKYIHFAVPAISMWYQKEADNIDGESNRIDYGGFVCPSAELEAIYNMEVVCT